MERNIERKQNIIGGQVLSGHLTSGSTNNLGLWSARTWVEISVHSVTYFRKSINDCSSYRALNDRKEKQVFLIKKVHIEEKGVKNKAQ